MKDNEDTYSIVVKKVNKKPKIVSVTKNGTLMKPKDIVPYPNFEIDPPSNPELVNGCVGLGVVYETEGREICRWLWGKWF